MTHIKICIGGTVFGITSRFVKTLVLSEKYLTEKASEYEISVTDGEIERVKKALPSVDDVRAEEIVIRDKVNDVLLRTGRATIHAAAVAVGGSCFLFAAHSGGGKTTQAKLWKAHFGDDAEIINGDFPLISFDGDTAYASGTPWCGKECISENKTARIEAVCFIVKSSRNEIRRLGSKEIISKLFDQLIIPSQAGGLMPECLAIADKLMKNVPFYELECDISDEAVTVAYDAMKSGK